MITKLESSLDLSKKILGITLESVIPTKIGKGLKINIPVLMSKITKEEPKKSPLYSKGTSVFINASDCKPQAKTNLHEINYLVAARESNASLNEILVKKEDGKTYEIPKGTKLEIECVMEKISKLTFNTNKFSNIDEESEDEEDTTEDPSDEIDESEEN